MLRYAGRKQQKYYFLLEITSHFYFGEHGGRWWEMRLDTKSGAKKRVKTRKE